MKGFVFANLQQPAAAKRSCCNVYFWFIFARSIIKSPHFVFLLRKKWLFYKKSLIAKFHQSCCNMRQFAATFFIFEPGNPSGWKEHVKMYQNPKFHIVCQIWSLYMKNVINPVYQKGERETYKRIEFEMRSRLRATETASYHPRHSCMSMENGWIESERRGFYIWWEIRALESPSDHP